MKYLFLMTLSLFLFCNQEPTLNYKPVDMKIIELSGKYGNENTQISGMDWYDDTLFILPQIPSEQNNTIFFVSRSEILEKINGNNEALVLHDYNFVDDGIKEKIKDIPDYEGIAFKSDSVYMLIELEHPMRSYIVMGRISANGIILQPEGLTEIHIIQNLPEMACEALTIFHKKILVFYEANGANIQAHPKVFCFDLSLKQIDPVELENIEYRITDATNVNADSTFWVVNNFWPGEYDLLKPATENLIPSTTDSNKRGVKRLFNLKLSADSIRIINNRPIMLPPQDWNWEGLVKFDKNSFLIVNDSHSTPPLRTAIGYIRISSNE